MTAIPGETPELFVQPPFAANRNAPLLETRIPQYNEVQNALEWGFSKEPELATEVWDTVTSGQWQGYGDNIRFKVGWDEAYIARFIAIRSAPTDDSTRFTKNLVATASSIAKTRNAERAGYDQSVAIKTEQYEKERHKVTHKTGVRALGEAALGGTGTCLTALAYGPTLPTFVVGGLVGLDLLLEGVALVSRTLRLGMNFRNEVNGLNNPPMPADAEKSWQKLRPVFERMVNAYGPVNDSDIKLYHTQHAFDVEKVREKLWLPGGPEIEDYTDVLLSMDVHRKNKPRRRRIDPAELVQGMLNITEGKIWNEQFAAVVTALSEAQTTLFEAQAKLDEVKSAPKHTLYGEDTDEREQELETSISTSRDVIDLSILQLLKLKREYQPEEVVSDDDDVPVELPKDPYAEDDVLNQQ